MSTVDELHEQAMDIAEDAFRLQRRGDLDAARPLFLDALALEREAAEQIPVAVSHEPSRSILFRSAAALAFNGGDYDAAQQLIVKGLSGFPPPEIHDELWSIFEDVKFMRHLNQRQMDLDPRQCVMSLGGAGVASGIAPAEQVMARLERLRSIVYRTAERLLNLPYRLNGGVSKLIRDYYELYLTALAPGSFSVSFQLGRPLQQMELLPLDNKVPEVDPTVVIDEVLTCLRLYERDHSEELRVRIPDQIYFDNFVGLAKEMAPDGEVITRVGLAANGDTLDTGTPTVVLQRNRKQFRAAAKQGLPDIDPDGETEVTVYHGTLMYASTPIDADADTGQVKLVVRGTSQQIKLHVPIALMKDVVKPYYEENVIVSVRKIGKRTFLQEVMLDNEASNSQ